MAKKKFSKSKGPRDLWKFFLLMGSLWAKLLNSNTYRSTGETLASLGEWLDKIVEKLLWPTSLTVRKEKQDESL